MHSVDRSNMADDNPPLDWWARDLGVSPSDNSFWPLLCLDTYGSWVEAKVIGSDFANRTVLVHYKGWSSRWDEHIALDSPRIKLMAPDAPAVAQKAARVLPVDAEAESLRTVSIHLFGAGSHLCWGTAATDNSSASEPVAPVALHGAARDDNTVPTPRMRAGALAAGAPVTTIDLTADDAEENAPATEPVDASHVDVAGTDADGTTQRASGLADGAAQGGGGTARTAAACPPPKPSLPGSAPGTTPEVAHTPTAPMPPPAMPAPGARAMPPALAAASASAAARGHAFLRVCGAPKEPVPPDQAGARAASRELQPVGGAVAEHDRAPPASPPRSRAPPDPRVQQAVAPADGAGASVRSGRCALQPGLSPFVGDPISLPPAQTADLLPETRHGSHLYWRLVAPPDVAARLGAGQGAAANSSPSFEGAPAAGGPTSSAPDASVAANGTTSVGHGSAASRADFPRFGEEEHTSWLESVATEHACGAPHGGTPTLMSTTFFHHVFFPGYS